MCLCTEPDKVRLNGCFHNVIQEASFVPFVEWGMALHIKSSHHDVTSAPLLPSQDTTDAGGYPGVFQSEPYY